MTYGQDSADVTLDRAVSIAAALTAAEVAAVEHLDRLARGLTVNPVWSDAATAAHLEAVRLVRRVAPDSRPRFVLTTAGEAVARVLRRRADRSAMHDAQTVYISGGRLDQDSPVAYLADHMSGCNADVYRAAIAELGVDQVAADDWHDVWTTGDTVHATRADAEAYAEAHDRPAGRVLEVTLEDVRRALLRAFIYDRDA